jgi:integrase
MNSTEGYKESLIEGRLQMGNVRRHGKGFQLIYQVAGERHFETVYVKNRSEALEELKKREGKAAEGKLPSRDARKLTFGDLEADLLNDYQTNSRRSLPTLRGHLGHLRKYFMGWRAIRISTADARAYAAQRLGEGAESATVNRELAKLKRMFSLAIQAGRIDTKPHIPLLRENNVRKGFFEPDAFEAVSAYLPQYLKPVAEFAYYVGWRRSEITSLKWEQVEVQERVLRLWPGTTKNEEGRVLPLEGELWRVIESQHKTRPPGCPWVFHRGGRRIFSFDKAWRSACAHAGCPDMLFHDLRRTAARSLRRAGLGDAEAMKITGHKTPSIFRRYSIVAESDLRDAVWRAQAFVASERAAME